MGALRHRDYRVFWSGSVVAGVGLWMQLFAVGWMLAELAVREGRPDLASLYLGLLGLANAVPSLLLTPVAGAIADRRDQRLILLASNAGAAVIGVAFAGLALSGAESVALIVVLYGCLSAVRAFDLPVRWTVVARIVPAEDQVSAIGLQAASFNVPQILGPAAGGALIAVLGAGGLLVVAAVLSVPVIVALLAMAPIPAVPSTTPSSVLGDVRDGLAFVLRHPIIRPAILVTIAVAFFARPSVQLMPAFTVVALQAGAAELSWLLSATGIGGVIGGLVVANLGGTHRRGLAFFGAAIGAGLTVVALGVQVSLVPALLVSFLAGLTAMLFSGISNTVFQMLSPESLRGRVLAVYTMIFVGFIPLGTLALGSLGAVIGVDRTLVVGGLAVIAAAALVALRVPGLRDLRAPRLDLVPPPAGEPTLR
jgi:MFS family permease